MAMASSQAKETDSGRAYFAGLPPAGGSGRPAICALRQAGHQQPVAVLPVNGTGMGTAGGSAMHQHGPLAAGSVWPQLKGAPQSVQRLIDTGELTTVWHTPAGREAGVTGGKKAGWRTYRARL